MIKQSRVPNAIILDNDILSSFIKENEIPIIYFTPESYFEETIGITHNMKRINLWNVKCPFYRIGNYYSIDFYMEQENSQIFYESQLKIIKEGIEAAIDLKKVGLGYKDN